MLREICEELGYTACIIGRIGEAIQYFHAVRSNTHYEMHAVFFRAVFIGASNPPAEHEVCWLNMDRPGPFFFHACHDWAVRQQGSKP